MTIFIAALLLAGSVPAERSGIISGLGGFKAPETTSNSFAINNIGAVLRGLSLTFRFRTAQPHHHAAIADRWEATSSEKTALPTLTEIHGLIHAAASKHGVPPEFVKSIVAAESNFDPDVVSPKGAIGLMQLMPATAREYGADPAIPAQNVDAGTRYLGFLMKKYRKSRNPLGNTIAAYNAGPGAVDRYRGVPPFRETRGYVVRVLGFLKHFRSQRE